MLVIRKNAPDQGLWGFPGGHVLFGETLLNAAEREMHEETNLNVHASKHLDYIEFISHNLDDTPAHHFLLGAVLCKYVGGKIVAKSDADDARWFTLEEVLALPCSEGVANLAQKAIAL